MTDITKESANRHVEYCECKKPIFRVDIIRICKTCGNEGYEIFDGDNDEDFNNEINNVIFRYFGK